MSDDREWDRFARRLPIETHLVSRVSGPLNMRDLRPKRSRAMWFVSRLLGNRSIFGYTDETPRKRLVIRLEDRQRPP